ncbi:hypothetical protein [Butyrivibrio sp.]|uniref:hypothetical protein n=1 Tax=Butyrivibrio sp. TaxID=28121 RepID=UPI0025C186A0|nr:hypothetical protein [Butyrivibrio sp.]MBQ9301651.1 hypothetical protein [Butyrivibrio sp.]
MVRKKDIEYQNKILRENVRLLKSLKLNNEIADLIKDTVRQIDKSIDNVEDELGFLASRDDTFDVLRGRVSSLRDLAVLLEDVNSIEKICDAEDELYKVESFAEDVKDIKNYAIDYDLEETDYGNT